MKNKLKIFTTYAFFAMGCLANAQIGIGTTTPASGFEINTSMGLKVTTITAATTLNQTHNVVLCNTGSYTVTLPAAATNTGKVYYIKNIDSDGDYFTLDGNGSETIDGSTNYYLRGYKHSIRIISDGTNWHVLEEAPSNGTFHCGEYKDLSWFPITNPITGKTWMDRNLGASKVAVSHTDTEAYGDLYQWGRLADGHQCRNSATNSTSSTGDVPGHGDFILEESSPFNWRTTANDSLWQGLNGTNNPCPEGYRIPTSTEWSTEYATWSAVSGDAALASFLRIPVGPNLRNYANGSIGGVFTYLWTSTYHDSSRHKAFRFSYATSGAGIVSLARGYGMNVRCIKD